MYCENLPVLDALTDSSDPYVVVELLPAGLFSSNSKANTKTVNKNLNPQYNENFTL
jgi:hypothetical protein